MRTARSNAEAVRGADVVLLTVKPQQARAVLEEIGALLGPKQLLVSAVASVSTALIEGALTRRVPVVRAVPNTPALVRQAMTGLARGSHAGDAHVRRAQAIFDAVGRTLVLDERHMDAVTGLSASGPRSCTSSSRRSPTAA